MDYPIKTITQLKPILQGFRKASGFSQAAIAKKLGITQQSYAEFELNPHLASAERLLKILRLFNVEVSLAQINNHELSEKVNSKTAKKIESTNELYKPTSKSASRNRSKTRLDSAKKEIW